MKTQKYKASVLAVALIILGVMVVISLGVSFSSMQIRKSSTGSSRSNVAFQNADSGMEAVMQKIKDNPLGTVDAVDNDGNCDGIYNSPDGKYTVELKDGFNGIINPCDNTIPVSNIVKIKSTGYSSQDSRAIEAEVYP